ncbi:MAG: ABC transporter permease [Bacteroidota bacterium]|nr:ABC transporter permease [Bacteroidota bacterium]
MVNLEFVRLAWDTVRSHKLRSALTLLGIVIGVFAIIVAVTAVQVVETSVVNTVESFGTTTFSISSRSSFSQSGTRYRARKNLTYDHMLQYKEQAELVEAISPQLTVTSVREARFGDRKTDLVVQPVGTNEHWVDNNGFSVERGRNLTSTDIHLARPVVVIGYELDEMLFPSVSAVGKSITVGGHRYRVIGVLARKGETFGENMDRLALVPITRMISIYSAGARNLRIQARTAHMNLLDDAMEEAIGILRVVRGVQPGDENNFEVESNESLLDEFRNLASRFAAGVAAVGLITLLTAGIGIMNIMLVSVTERTREIGIRKAVGARRNDVLAQFLYEAVFLCQIGGLLGILVGILGGNIVGFFTKTPFVFPWLWAFGAVLGVSFVAMVFGVYPAYKAAKLDPIEALRHE